LQRLLTGLSKDCGQSPLITPTYLLLLVVLVAAPTRPVVAVVRVDILPFRRKLLQPGLYTQFQWAVAAQVGTPVLMELVHQ
jgi:hypothetical protein